MPDDTQVLAEPLPALALLQTERAELLGPIPGGQAEQEPPARDPVQAGGGLGDVQRVPHRQDDAGGSQRDLGRVRRDVRQVDPRVVDLPDVTERGHSKRDVTDVEGREPTGLGGAGGLDLGGQFLGRRVVAAGAQREAQAEREAAGREGAAMPRQPAGVVVGAREQRAGHAPHPGMAG